MRSNHILETAAAVFLSVQSISLTGVHARRLEITGVDPENYVSKQVTPEIASGGIQKLYDQGVLRFESEIESTKAGKPNRRKMIGGGLRSRSSGASQQKTAKAVPSSGRNGSGGGGGNHNGSGSGSSGGGGNHNGSGAAGGGNHNGNNGAADGRYYYETPYDDYYAGVPVSYDDDQLVAEEIITMEYYQDNRFSNPDPIFANPVNPSREASGNRWLYANVPLQPIFGINDLPIQGLAQGFCESLFEDQDGMCHFTYEFFDLRDGAIVVYASITAEGATVPQGPSTLNILGGTGEFSGVVGEVTLYPVGIDESTIPARIFRDGSLFLGNLNGYEAKFNMSVRYQPNAPIQIPVPVSQNVQAPIAAPVAAPVSVQTEDQQAASAGFANRVTCPGQVESEYCDCDLDCTTTSARCGCDQAQGTSCCAF